MKSEYEKILESQVCPSCGGRLEILSPPILVVRGEEYLTLPGRVKCARCGDEWEFTHVFQCPNCGHQEELPTNKCPVCGSAMEPQFQFEPAPSFREREIIVIVEDLDDDDICDFCDNQAAYKFKYQGRSICSCPCHVNSAINSLFSY